MLAACQSFICDDAFYMLNFMTRTMIYLWNALSKCQRLVVKHDKHPAYLQLRSSHLFSTSYVRVKIHLEAVKHAFHHYYLIEFIRFDRYLWLYTFVYGRKVYSTPRKMLEPLSQRWTSNLMSKN